MSLQLTAIAALVAALLGASGAWTARGWLCTANEAERVAAEAEARAKQASVANTAATGHERDKVKLQTKFVTITETVEKVIENPIYNATCFSPDGMRTHSDAVSLTGAASQPSDPVPTPAPIK